MNLFILKLIAITAMFIDHLGKGFFPDHLYLQAIGRLAFPIFAWSIATGYRKTRNVSRYMIRLLIFAIVSQLPFYLYINSFRELAGPFSYLNVIVTLLFGLMAIYVYEQSRNKTVGFGFVLLASFATLILNTDFALVGVLVIFAFHIFYDDFKKLFLFLSILLAWPSFLYLPMLIRSPLEITYWANMIPFAYLISLLFIQFYNGKQGIRAKYLFYFFYPGHFMLLYWLKLMLTLSS